MFRLVLLHQDGTPYAPPAGAIGYRVYIRDGEGRRLLEAEGAPVVIALDDRSPAILRELEAAFVDLVPVDRRGRELSGAKPAPLVLGSRKLRRSFPSVRSFAERRARIGPTRPPVRNLGDPVQRWGLPVTLSRRLPARASDRRAATIRPRRKG